MSCAGIQEESVGVVQDVQEKSVVRPLVEPTDSLGVGDDNEIIYETTHATGNMAAEISIPVRDSSLGKQTADHVPETLEGSGERQAGTHEGESRLHEVPRASPH